jgi:hypothetical protein
MVKAATNIHITDEMWSRQRPISTAKQCNYIKMTQNIPIVVPRYGTLAVALEVFKLGCGDSSLERRV